MKPGSVDPFVPLAFKPADRFRPQEHWRGPDGRLCVVKPAPVAGHVFLVDVRSGRHELVPERAVVGFRRGRG